TYVDANSTLSISLSPATADYHNPLTLSEKLQAESQAAPVSSMSSVSSGDSATSMSLMGTLMAADPTGTFFMFTKILQIVNKLYFININYGKRLEAFLAKSAPEGKVDPDPKKPQRVYNLKNSRGKLTQKTVPL